MEVESVPSHKKVLSIMSTSQSSQAFQENVPAPEEDQDIIHKSAKRMKEDVPQTIRSLASSNPSHQGASYKDKLAGSLLGAFEEAFRNNDCYEDNTGDDVPPEDEVNAPKVL